VGKAIVGKALMMIGGCLAAALFGAFLLASFGEQGDSRKLMVLLIGLLGMIGLFLVGYCFRLVGARRDSGSGG
jgi:hypothetical protein